MAATEVDCEVEKCINNEDYKCQLELLSINKWGECDYEEREKGEEE